MIDYDYVPPDHFQFLATRKIDLLHDSLSLTFSFKSPNSALIDIGMGPYYHVICSRFRLIPAVKSGSKAKTGS